MKRKKGNALSLPIVTKDKSGKKRRRTLTIPLDDQETRTTFLLPPETEFTVENLPDAHKIVREHMRKVEHESYLMMKECMNHVFLYGSVDMSKMNDLNSCRKELEEQRAKAVNEIHAELTNDSIAKLSKSLITQRLASK